MEWLGACVVSGGRVTALDVRRFMHFIELCLSFGGWAVDYDGSSFFFKLDWICIDSIQLEFIFSASGYLRL